MPTARYVASTVLVQGANEEAGAEDADLLACANYRDPPAGERVSAATLAEVTIGDIVAVYWHTPDPSSGTKGEWFTGIVKKICSQSQVVAVKYPNARCWYNADIRAEYVVRAPKVCRRLP